MSSMSHIQSRMRKGQIGAAICSKSMSLPGLSIGENNHNHNKSKTNNKFYIRLDATKEDGRLARLISHQHESENPNLAPKIFMENNTPHLLLFATRDIRSGKKLNSNFQKSIRSDFR